MRPNDVLDKVDMFGMLVSIFFTPFLKRRLPLILFSQLPQSIGGVVFTTWVLMSFAKPTVLVSCSVLSMFLRLSAALLPKSQQKRVPVKALSGK